MKYIHEPTDLQCGQAVLAMLLDKNVDEICRRLDNDRETTLKEMRQVLTDFGVEMSAERKSAQSKNDLPECALLSLETPRCWHWSLYRSGVFYDPEHGVSNDFPECARKYYWTINERSLIMSLEDVKLPKLGFGLMRLPTANDEIDMKSVCDMVDAYMKAGMNYFDTAYVYHGGKSEVAAREAVVKRYPRDAFFLATKLPAWELKSGDDRDRIFNEQCERAGVDYFDFYLLHSVEDGYNYDTYVKYDCFEWGKKKREEGKIKHFGFSFHGTPQLLETILDAHPEVEFVQIQLNYTDWNNQIVQSGALYKIVTERNIPIIVMEPIKGGFLANVPEEADKLMKQARPDKSIASWAMRYVGSLPGIAVILSGMSSEEQMADNIGTFTSFEPLSDAEMEVIAKTVSIIQGMPLIGCTSCRYCTDGCPQSIAIPDIFRALNTLRTYPADWRSKAFYGKVTAGSGKASDCIGCGQCEGVCPQHLPIIELLKEAAERFEEEGK